jgi:hypothetical protein
MIAKFGIYRYSDVEITPKICTFPFRIKYVGDKPTRLESVIEYDQRNGTNFLDVLKTKSGNSRHLFFKKSRFEKIYNEMMSKWTERAKMVIGEEIGQIRLSHQEGVTPSAEDADFSLNFKYLKLRENGTGGFKEIGIKIISFIEK